MAKTTSVSLDDQSGRFVEEQVASGRFASASDVVRAALELLEQNEAKRAALKQAIQEGLDSGEAKPFDRAQFFRDVRAKHGQSVG